MTEIIVIILCIWGFAALWLTKLLWKFLNSKKRPQLSSEAQPSLWQTSKSIPLQLLIAAFIFALPIYISWDFIPDSNFVWVVNESSATEVSLLSMIVDGVKIDYQDPLLAKKKFLAAKVGRFEATSHLYDIEVWIKQENLPPKKYSCKVQGIPGGGQMQIIYLDSGIKCSKHVYIDDSPIF